MTWSGVLHIAGLVVLVGALFLFRWPILVGFLILVGILLQIGARMAYFHETQAHVRQAAEEVREQQRTDAHLARLVR